LPEFSQPFLQKTPYKVASKKNNSSCDFGRHFFQKKACWTPFFLHIFREFVKEYRDFALILQDFALILRNFARIFTKLKLWRCACNPCTPASCTSAAVE